jgi:hypothetical protein
MDPKWVRQAHLWPAWVKIWAGCGPVASNPYECTAAISGNKDR